jgi:hypothetical protein
MGFNGSPAGRKKVKEVSRRESDASKQSQGNRFFEN